MLLGQKLKTAIAESEFTTDEVADYIGITPNNLYRLYKKESFEVKYLLKAAEKLNLTLGYFLDDETIGSILHSNTGQANYANKVGSNQQSINVGSGDLQHKLDECEKERDLLRKAVADKELIIELMKGKKAE